MENAPLFKKYHPQGHRKHDDSEDPAQDRVRYALNKIRSQQAANNKTAGDKYGHAELDIAAIVIAKRGKYRYGRYHYGQRRPLGLVLGKTEAVYENGYEDKTSAQPEGSGKCSDKQADRDVCYVRHIILRIS